MCGIAGYLGAFSPDLLTRMVHAMPHRGPDGFGEWHAVEDGIGLAHRRLSILDLTTAASQPMAGCGGRYYVSFNGEIYNFKELYNNLKADYELNPNSDTSVLIPLYDRYGPDMVNHLNGMFAFAIWDTQEKTLFIARDHMGIKPVYYTQTTQGFVFASELKTLLQAPGVSRELDETALLDYMTYIWSPGERTPFRRVKKLDPGCAILLKAGEEVRPRKYYTPPLSGGDYDEKKSVADLSSLLDKVIEDQCVSDVPVGLFSPVGWIPAQLWQVWWRAVFSHSKHIVFLFKGRPWRMKGLVMTLAMPKKLRTT